LNTHGRIIWALLLVVLIAVSLAAAGAAAQPGVSVGAAFRRFWNARSLQEAQNASADIVGSGMSFTDAFYRLRPAAPVLGKRRARDIG
jgi:hypothetical protein